MQQLTGLDAAFLALETANSTAHIGGVCILDPTDAPRDLDLESLTELLAQRVPLVPVLRRRLMNVPFGLDQPYWMDDPDFDIEYHVREIALPRPGSDAQLTEQISRLHARPLDRRRPLWEIYLITGLAEDRMAVYTKLHHAAIDGVSGVGAAHHPPRPVARGPGAAPAEEFVPAAPATPARRVVARAAGRLTRRPVELVRIANGVRPPAADLRPRRSGSIVGGVLGLDRGDGGVIATSAGPGSRHPVQPADHRRTAGWPSAAWTSTR